MSQSTTSRAEKAILCRFQIIWQNLYNASSIFHFVIDETVVQEALIVMYRRIINIVFIL